MTREEYLTMLISQQYKSIRKFSQVCGIPYASLHRILSSEGIMSTSAKNVYCICERLNVSVHELLSHDDFPVAHDSTVRTLGPHEERIIKKYREQTDMQPAIDRLLQIEQKICKK